MKSHQNASTVLLLVSGDKLILTILLFVSSISYSHDFLPFEVNSKEYNFLKDADADFNGGNYKSAAINYNSSTQIIKHFPYHQYKFSIALFLIKDTIRAKQVFYNALKNGLLFDNIAYLKKSPLTKELSFNLNVYDLAKKTCYLDSLSLFSEIREKLIDLREKDQTVRNSGYKSYTMSEIDSSNRIVLDSIINLIGWPGYKEVGKLGAKSAWIIAQHSDNDLVFQNKCLYLMKNEYLRNNTSSNHYAMLIDRWLVNNGKKQIFGSQVTFDEKLQKVISKPCEYPDQINFLRSLYLFGDLEGYLKMMQDKY